jgi:Tol biopolymer transport system component/DNA-binding winged helix-turn-helix (wHTH) protein
MEILEFLALRAGELVSREELREAIWPNESYGEFDAGLGNAVRKIRVALNDDADNARFIKTIPKKGYCFIAPVSDATPAPLPRPAEEPDSITLAAEPKAAEVRAGRARLWWWCGGGAGVIVLAAALLWSRPSPPSLQGVRPLVETGGRPAHPALSASGDLLAFDWQGPEDVSSAIYVQRLDDTSAVRLTKGAQVETWPVFSPDGKQVAFLRELTPTRMAVLTAPLVGLGEREVFEFERGPGERPRLAWSPDGRWMATAERKQGESAARVASAILLYSPATGERRTLTHPLVDWRGDSEPTFSADSKRVAFRRTRPASGEEDIFEIAVEGGNQRQLTGDNSAIAALVYTNDGGILFSSRRGGWLRNLWWMGAGGGAPRLLSDPAFDLGSPAISRDGRHLAYMKVTHDENIWRMNIGADRAEQVSASEFIENGPTFSPDGRKLAFVSARTGRLQVWVASVSGAGAIRLTDAAQGVVESPQWSPDGKWIAYAWQAKGQEGIYLISNTGGSPRALAGGSGESMPRWSRDGRSVYFDSTRSGRQQVWRVAIDGGPATQMTTNGGGSGTESADGKRLYYSHTDEPGIWSVALDNGLPAGAESKVMDQPTEHDAGNWALGRDGIYFVRRDPANRGPATICFFRFSDGSVRELWTMKAPPLYEGSGLAISPDEKTLLFAEVDRDGTSIYGR